jgi:hypothetical protein
MRQNDNPFSSNTGAIAILLSQAGRVFSQTRNQERVRFVEKLFRLSDSPVVNVTGGGGETGFYVIK